MSSAREKELEEQLTAERTARELLEARDADRDRFVAMLVHDLRQPLAVIEMAAVVLRRLNLGEQAEGSIARILAAETHLDELAAELLDMGSARFGMLQRERLSLRELIEQLVPAERGIDIDMPVDFSGQWDRKRVSRILQNLIGNAILHSSPEAAIAIRCKKSGADVLVIIENQCEEVDAADLVAMFEPFRRASQHGRVGLGLHIARELARAHGGELTSSWRAGRIAFVLTLPLGPPDPQYAQPRRHRRTQLEGELEVAAGERVFWVKGRDISQRGLAFFCEEQLAVSERIKVAVYSDGSSFSLLGTVRHAERGVIGVEFPAELTQAELDVLKKPRPRRPS